MNLVLILDSKATAEAQAVPAFQAALQYVVNLFDNTFTNNVGVTIEVGWGEYYNVLTGTHEAIPNSDAAVNTENFDVTYLTAGKYYTTAQLAAFGGQNTTAFANGPDGWMGFRSDYNWSFAPALANAAVPQGACRRPGRLDVKWPCGLRQ